MKNSSFLAISMAIMLLFVSLASASTETDARKYQEIFYPQGMPMEPEYYSGESQQAVYREYDETQVPSLQAGAVLYSKNVPNGRDSLHSVYIGLFSDAKSMQVIEVTKYLPVYLEVPGHFYRMDGRIEYLHLSKNLSILHVNLWSILTGTGSESGGSDLFFTVDNAGLVSKPLLVLSNTSHFNKQGYGNATSASSSIKLMDIDKDGVKEILLKKTSVEKKDGVILRPIGRKVEVYRLRDRKLILFEHEFDNDKVWDPPFLKKSSNEIVIETEKPISDGQAGHQTAEPKKVSNEVAPTWDQATFFDNGHERIWIFALLAVVLIGAGVYFIRRRGKGER